MKTQGKSGSALLLFDLTAEVIKVGLKRKKKLLVGIKIPAVVSQITAVPNVCPVDELEHLESIVSVHLVQIQWALEVGSWFARLGRCLLIHGRS